MDGSPVRINKYLADRKYCTRREADVLIEAGRVKINGRKAVLGDKVRDDDVVELNQAPRTFKYLAYNKPRGVITHSPQYGEKDIHSASGLEGVFPVGRLDKDSSGLIILTDDGRLTDALLNPEHEHEKEYEVTTRTILPASFRRAMERGVDIEDSSRRGYRTKKCRVRILGAKKFSVTLTEGKKHQIRRMCDALGQSVEELKRVRIMDIKLGGLAPGAHRELSKTELAHFLGELGLRT